MTALLLLFLKSIVMGVAIAAPLGPIGALCINRTLERGFWAGVAGGVGTALADAFYAGLAAIGFAAFAAFLVKIAIPLSLVGGGFLIWLGLKGMRPSPPREAARADTDSLLGTIAVTFLLTLSNPATILAFAGIFAGLGLASEAGDLRAGIVVAGVFIGSLIWWFLLSGFVAASHRRLPTSFALWAGRLSGLLMLAFGIFAVATGLRALVDGL